MKFDDPVFQAATKFGTRLPFLCLLSVSSVCLASVAQAAPSLTVPPASFLDYHIASVQQLSQEVSRDGVVRERLAHHFHLTEAATADFVRQDLGLTRLTTARRVRMYCVTPEGREYAVSTVLPANTPVFTLHATGEPILKLVCGNPLVAALPQTLQSRLPTGKPHLVAQPTADSVMAAQKPGLTVFTQATVPPDTMLVAENAPLAPPAVSEVGGFSQLLTPRAGVGSVLPIIGVVPLYTLLQGGKSSARVPNHVSPPAAPEPDGRLVAAVCLLLPGVLIARRKLRTVKNARGL